MSDYQHSFPIMDTMLMLLFIFWKVWDERDFYQRFIISVFTYIFLQPHSSPEMTKNLNKLMKRNESFIKSSATIRCNCNFWQLVVIRNMWLHVNFKFQFLKWTNRKIRYFFEQTLDKIHVFNKLILVFVYSAYINDIWDRKL